ncbi:hypothetical protein [Stackebrandtia nassauensis]|uniref:Uncharacterized protein n=1 Tax=Stackebrandtia nassauensis (strain DSM 44728 / CIP 108903 / NRRL B-16338 / NBRC 102104 / LLR-40K-21) TaxID=446470 RepID=D3Q970_STANL|nr:hypothetical protein [Stackebrandtia nassauensis]ADD40679.1 hypothetical protein Snas_0969 [Stackebrandtia nassauensis DSM 44728]
MTISLIFAGLGIAFSVLGAALSIRTSRRSEDVDTEGASEETGPAPKLSGSLNAAADQLEDAIDVFAAEYGQHHPADVNGEAARRVFARLATVTSDLKALRGNGSVVTS